MSRLIRVVLFTLALVCTGALSFAQTTIDFNKWEKDAAKIEQILAVGAASDATLEEERAALVTWREQFQAQKD